MSLSAKLRLQTVIEHFLFDNEVDVNQEQLNSKTSVANYEVGDRVNDSISFSYFCDLLIDQIAPIIVLLVDLELR